MITKPPIDELTKKAGNKYVLCCATAKRAKFINTEDSVEGIVTNAKAISKAAEELDTGIIEIVKED